MLGVRGWVQSVHVSVCVYRRARGQGERANTAGASTKHHRPFLLFFLHSQ